MQTKEYKRAAPGLIRQILKEHGEPMTITEILSALEKKGYTTKHAKLIKVLVRGKGRELEQNGPNLWSAKGM